MFEGASCIWTRARRLGLNFLLTFWLPGDEAERLHLLAEAMTRDACIIVI